MTAHNKLYGQNWEDVLESQPDIKLAFVLNFECVAIISYSKTDHSSHCSESNTSSVTGLRNWARRPHAHDPQTSQKSVVNTPHPLFDGNMEKSHEGVGAGVDASLIEDLIPASDTVYNCNRGNDEHHGVAKSSHSRLGVAQRAWWDKVEECNGSNDEEMKFGIGV